MDAKTIRIVSALSCLVQAVVVIQQDGRVNKWLVAATLAGAAVVLFNSARG
jgi:hypothetical protein